MRPGFMPRAEALHLPSLRGPAIATTVLIAVNCAVGVLLAIMSTSLFMAIHTVVNDDEPRTDELLTQQVLDARDALGSAAAIAVVYLLAGLTAGILFLVWLWRARLSAEWLTPHHRLSRGWTIGGWFCPIVNFWCPFQIVRDIWYGSQPPGQQRLGAGVVGVWWATWLLSNIVSSAAQFTIPSRATSIRQLIIGAEVAVWTTVVSALLTCVCGVLAIRIVWRITHWQAIPRHVQQPVWR